MEVHVEIPVLVADGVAPATIVGGLGIAGDFGLPVAQRVLGACLSVEFVDLGTALTVLVDKQLTVVASVFTLDEYHATTGLWVYTVGRIGIELSQ